MRRKTKEFTWAGLSPEVKAFGHALQAAGVIDQRQKENFFIHLDSAYKEIKRQRVADGEVLA